MSFLVWGQLRRSGRINTLMALLIATFVFLVAGGTLATTLITDTLLGPASSFLGGDVGVVRSRVVPRIVPMGLQVAAIWEWDVFTIDEIAGRLPNDSAILSLTLCLPGMSVRFRQTSQGKLDYSGVVRERVRLLGRSVGPDGLGLKVADGRSLTAADDGQAVLLLPTSHYLCRDMGVRVGDELRCLVPRVRRNQGIPDPIGIPVPGLGGPYLDLDDTREATFKVVGLVDEPLMNDVVLVPLGTLQDLAGAQGLCNEVGLSSSAESVLNHEAVSLGGGFYVVSPAFIAAPLVIQAEALTTQGRLLVLAFALTTVFVLTVLAVADLAQRRRELSLLQALGLTRTQLAFIGFWRFSGALVGSLILAVVPVIALAIAYARNPLQCLASAFQHCWPVLALLMIAAVLSVLMAPRRPMEGLTCG